MTDNIFDKSGFSVQGHIHIFDPSTGETIINKRNAIHYENMSIALAESLSNAGQGFVYQMAFGNGGTSVDPTGIITYLTPNSTGVNASLYNQTFIKVVDDQSANNTDPNRNKIETRHVTGTNYTDILVSTILDYGEPSGQDANDTAQNTASNFVFDELGLGDDLQRARNGRKIRAGKATMRGRVHKTPKSVLLVVKEKSGLAQAARNLPGVDVVAARDLNAEDLAPGGDVGRLTVFTKTALEELN